MTRKPTYDPKCYELAVHFLQDEESLKYDEVNADAIASAIQQAIEDEITYLKSENKSNEK